MAIELRTYASGDTDYIAKMNQNVAIIEAALNSLQAQIAAAAGSGSAVSAGTLIAGMFNYTDGLMGPDSYKVTQNSTSVTVLPGTMFLADSLSVVASLVPFELSFVGLGAGTKYITVDALGTPVVSATPVGGVAYSVVWTGSAFSGDPIRVAPVMFDTAEATAARHSDSQSPVVAYHQLDDRLEAIEEDVIDAAADAAEAIEIANETKAQLEVAVGVVARYRKVGITVNAPTGDKDSIQVDFDGEIVGWSVIGDASGDLSLEVSKAASSAPPSAPTVPDTTSDKISASAPIAISSAQSAASAEAGVSTWSTSVVKWDVIRFKLVTLSGMSKATAYIRILEVPPEQGITAGTIASGSVAEAPFQITQV